MKNALAVWQERFFCVSSGCMVLILGVLRELYRVQW